MATIGRLLPGLAACACLLTLLATSAVASSSHNSLTPADDRAGHPHEAAFARGSSNPQDGPVARRSQGRRLLEEVGPIVGRASVFQTQLAATGTQQQQQQQQVTPETPGANSVSDAAPTEGAESPTTGGASALEASASPAKVILDGEPDGDPLPVTSSTKPTDAAPGSAATATDGDSSNQASSGDRASGDHASSSVEAPGAGTTEHSTGPAPLPEDDVADSDWPTLEASVDGGTGHDNSREGTPGTPETGGTSGTPGTAVAAVAAETAGVARLLLAWAQSSFLRGRRGTNLSLSGVPRPPHLQDCLGLEQQRRNLDERGPAGQRPPWSLFGGASALGLGMGSEEAAPGEVLGEGAEQEETLLETKPSQALMGPLPPWVSGADEDNLVLTRRVQRDLWLLQHPRDCRAADVRLFIANVTYPRGFMGIGALFSAITGLLSWAVQMRRVLVLTHYSKADHDHCKGPLRGSFTCYFAQETSRDCHARAMEALEQGQAAMEGTPGSYKAPVLLSNQVFHFKDGAPKLWGTPWRHIHPTVQVHGDLVKETEDDSHRWFRAQGLRYLLRYPSTRLCLLTNRARHNAFGREAAVLVARALASKTADDAAPPEALGTETQPQPQQPLKPFWDRARLWVPQGGMISVHVRQGDKGQEMIIHPFKRYMVLAGSIRERFPDASSIWLSTEMQSVIEEAESYKGWKFFYTNVTRQGELQEAMSNYEDDLGKGLSTDNAFVNLMIATSCDYFVGTMGSTWSVIIDDLRRTSGKEAQGLLSVNKDRYWMSKEERAEKNLVS